MSRKPDYRVAALDKITEDKNNVGAAWKNEDGTISIVLDSFIVLYGGNRFLITLFPNTKCKP